MSDPRVLRWRLHGSPRLAAVLVLVHALGGWALWQVLPGLSGAALAGLLVALGLHAAHARALLRAAGSMRALEVGEDDRVELSMRDGRLTHGRASARRHVCRYWVALSLGAPARRAVLVTADMLEPAAFRRLRLWALWGEAARVVPAQRAS
ncbi:MAG TPA: protein YgfX [Burkholderiales bacterium]